MLPSIPKHEKLDKEISSTKTERNLGRRSVSRDTFVINSKKVDLEDHTHEKILKNVSSIYYPISFNAPFTVRKRQSCRTSGN